MLCPRCHAQRPIMLSCPDFRKYNRVYRCIQCGFLFSPKREHHYPQMPRSAFDDRRIA